jgi:hypothetical protein
MSEATKVEKAKAVIGGEAGVGNESSVHYDRPLSDFSVKVVQDDSEFKASQIIRPFNSKHRQDMYYFYEPAYFMINQVKERAEGTEAAMAKYGVKRKDYNTKVYGLKQPVTDETVANADKPVDRVYEDVTSFIVRQFLLNKEKLFAGALLTDGVWGTDWSGQDAVVATGDTIVDGGVFQKFTASTAKPLDVLDKAMVTVQLKSGLRPNTMVMTRTVFSALKRHSSIKTVNLYTQSNTGADDSILNTIAAHLSIPLANMHVLDVVEPATAATIDGATYEIDTDDEGYATGLANQFIGGNGILIMHIDKVSTGMYQATAAVCCQWTGLYPDAGALGNTVFKRYREEKLSSEMVEGKTAFSYHIVAPALGIYLKDVI